MHEELLFYLKTENSAGRHVVLCSASDQSLVQKVAAQLAFPVEIIASDGVMNLKGKVKAQTLTDRFGLRGFDYVGNSKADLAVWRQAREALVVGASAQVVKSARKQGNVTAVFGRTTNSMSAMLRALRVHQWVKNTLVFVPLLASHYFSHGDLVLKAEERFISMSFCASAVYIINDLMDIDSDRQHPSKRNRPFASGELPIPIGLLMAPLMLGGGIVLSLLLPREATVILLCYVALSTVYTYWLKEKLLTDVIALAILYTLRILEGGAATSLLVSPWLLAFSLFLFTSLAFIKRVTEIIHLSQAIHRGATGRGYFMPDSATLANLGIVNGFLACLVLSLYINSESVRRLYVHPGWLWLLVPLLLYWVGRIWVITMRGEMTDDPIVYLFRDKRTYLAIVLGGIVVLLAMSAPVGIPGVLE
jgi:4-hydroxybenzoate polyprenyltransferase